MTTRIIEIKPSTKLTRLSDSLLIQICRKYSYGAKLYKETHSEHIYQLICNPDIEAQILTEHEYYMRQLDDVIENFYFLMLERFRLYEREIKPPLKQIGCPTIRPLYYRKMKAA